MDSPLASVGHSFSTLFLLVTYHERNLQPLAEGEICNGTSFCLRQEPVTILASTIEPVTILASSEKGTSD